jgi:hypothetical protein
LAFSATLFGELARSRADRNPLMRISREAAARSAGMAGIGGVLINPLPFMLDILRADEVIK